MNALEHTEAHLRALFEGLPGLIEVRSLNGSGIPRPTFHTSIEDALEAIKCDANDDLNVYVGVATRGDRRNPETGKISGGKDNLVAARGWFIDRDGLTGEGAREEYEVVLEGFPFPPSSRIDSGGGEHDYWETEDYLKLDTPGRIDAFEKTNKGLADALGGDLSATDASRIMRVAGTWNIPNEKKAARGRLKAKCRIISHGNATYAPEDLEVFRMRGEALKPIPTTSSTKTGEVTFKPGQRHEALKRHAAFLRKSGLSPQAAEGALLVFNTERCDPPVPEDEVMALVTWAECVAPGDNCAQDVEPKPPAEVGAREDDDSPSGEMCSEDSSQRIIPPPRLLTALEWVNDAAPEAIVEGLIYFASTHLLTGASKAGKTWWALQLLMAIAKEWRFLGLETRKARVLLVSLELSAGMVRSRMEEVSQDVGLEMPIFGEEFHVVAPTASYLPHLDLGDDLGAIHLKDLIAETGAKLVILDTLYRFLPGKDPSSNQEMGEVFGRLNDLSQSSGAALLLVDHVAKGDQLGPVSHSGIGAQVKGGASRAIIGLKRTSKDSGGRWQLDVESHFGSWDEPIHYERPTRKDGTPGGGCVRCTATEAYGLSEQAVHDLFALGEIDDQGRRFFPSKRRLIEALITAQHATGNNDGGQMVNAIIRDYCKPEHAVGWGNDRPIVTSEGKRTATVFTWRMRDDATI